MDELTIDKVNIIGSYPPVPRVRTGLLSLDVALSDKGVLGAPMRSIYEIYGYPNAGKSSLAYYLSGKLSPTQEIAVCDLEMLDISYLQKALAMAGYAGDVVIMDMSDDKGKIKTHEQMMRDMVDRLDGESGAVILDSVGAIQPISEASGDFGEAFVGKRAKLVAQVSRAVSNSLRIKELPACAFVINHVHQIIGGRGHTTAGGETLKYMAAVRLMIWTEEVIKDTQEEQTLGFVAGGTVEKLRFGGRGKSFKYYIVPGFGVHQGASAMFDCFAYGLAERGSTVKIDGKSLGYLKKDLLEYAAQGKSRKFEPFMEIIADYEDELKREELEDDTSPAKRKSRKGSKSVDGDSEDAVGND
jgi:RecA/RadA recombinase